MLFEAKLLRSLFKLRNTEDPDNPNLWEYHPIGLALSLFPETKRAFIRATEQSGHFLQRATEMLTSPFRLLSHFGDYW